MLLMPRRRAALLLTLCRAAADAAIIMPADAAPRFRYFATPALMMISPEPLRAPLMICRAAIDAALIHYIHA